MSNLSLRNKNKGFTLIELLVVISIISLLSTVVMASLNSARTKAQEAAIKTDLQSVKTQAELSYNKFGNYSNISTEVAPILKHINNNGGTAIFYTVDNTHYAVSAKLNSDTTKRWSISDQNGLATWDTSDQPVMATWNNAKIICSQINRRLPTIEELKSYYDVTSSGGLIAGVSYWSSAEYTPNPIYGYYLDTSDGFVYGASDNNAYRVRCVN